MSEHSAAVAQSMSVPEDLVMRSAAARAQAQGVSVDDVLAAWSGGGNIAAAAPAPSAPAPPEPAPTPAEVPTEAAPAAVDEPVVADVVAPAAETVPAAVAVLEPEAEPIEAGSLRGRLMMSGKLGAVIGAMFGVLAVVVSTRFGLTRTNLAGTEDAVETVLLVEPSQVLLFVAVISAIFGALVARAAAVVPSWFDTGMAVRTSLRSITVLGAAAGAVLGAVAGGMLLGLGDAIEQLNPDDPSQVALNVVSSTIIVVIGGALLGALTAGLSQIVALPMGLTDAEEEESDIIKHRLATSYLMPVAVIVAIVAVVLPFAYLLIEFHEMAPIIAIVAAIGILGFAGLSASRPGMRISTGELVVAAIGIGIVLLFLALLANAWAGGGEAGHSEEAIRLLFG